MTAEPRFPKYDMDAILGGRRMRRNRRADWSRRLVRETVLTVDDLIWPIFIVPGSGIVEPVASMPGVNRMSVDKAVEAVKEAADLGIPAIATFPNIDIALRDETGSDGLNADNLINQATRAIKKAVPNIGIITDVALDPFTSHGHDGVLREGEIVNDETVEIIVKAAIAQADAGSDIIAPSEMMDGRIGAIRSILQANGLDRTVLMSYAAKFHSSFYGPFRVAADSAPKGELKLTDRASYQIDPARANDAALSVERDVAEGADVLMVKPGMPYLDILADLSRRFPLPWAVYEVSGEYAGIELMAEAGLADRVRAHREAWAGFVRAGASMIISYGARHAREWLG